MRLTGAVYGRFGAVVCLFFGTLCHGELLRVATFNLESYLDAPTETRAVKSSESRAKVRESIRALNPDVIALQELGSPSALIELRDSLKINGIELPYWHLLSGADTNIHLALLSRFPFAATRLYTNESFLLNGRRFHPSRGFAEIDIKMNPTYSFTVIAAHLKSKRPRPEADEAELRLEEAKLLREKIDARLANEPDLNLVVLGDFNDTIDSGALKTVMGRGRTRLVDTRPAERNGDARMGGKPGQRRSVTWTHFYANDDTYRRIDFILVSRGMAREWIADETYVLALPNWGLASDHRPVVATFEAADR